MSIEKLSEIFDSSDAEIELLRDLMAEANKEEAAFIQQMIDEHEEILDFCRVGTEVLKPKVLN